MWLQALPAEVDDCIANRDIEQAVELVVEWKACKTSDPAVDTQMQAREQQVCMRRDERLEYCYCYPRNCGLAFPSPVGLPQDNRAVFVFQ